MNRIILVSGISGDKEKIIERYSTKLTNSDIFCTSYNELDKLLKAEEIYFVFSKESVLSTNYQELIMLSLPIIFILPSIKKNKVKCFLILLDDLEIPKGFDFSSISVGIDIRGLPIKSL